MGMKWTPYAKIPTISLLFNHNTVIQTHYKVHVYMKLKHKEVSYPTASQSEVGQYPKENI